MPRGRRTVPLYPKSEEWRAARDERGQWVVANFRGEQVLRHAEPLARMHAVHLAASAPQLRELLRVVTTRLQSYLLDHGGSYSRDGTLCREALIAIAETRPPYEDVLREQRQPQLEMDLDAEGDVRPNPHESKRARRAG